MNWVLAFLMNVCFFKNLRGYPSFPQLHAFNNKRFCKNFFHSLSNSLMLDIPVVLTSFRTLADRYDVFLFDQFGVLHDGTALFSGVPETLAYLRTQGKTLCIVSNTSRRSAEISSLALHKFKLPAQTFDFIISSGERIYQHLYGTYAFRGGEPTKCVFVSRKDTSLDYLKNLGLQATEDVSQAKFLLIQGVEAIRLPNPSDDVFLTTQYTGSLDSPLLSLLSSCRAHHLPLLCANSDIFTIAGGETVYTPGLLADTYEKLGGTTLHFGKPERDIFDEAIAAGMALFQEDKNVNQSNISAIGTRSDSRSRSRSRVLHIGDSIYHDIRGR
jgi:HAD superfamily hydrolase (TIGR01459 family)